MLILLNSHGERYNERDLAGQLVKVLSAPIDETQIQYIAALSHCLDAVLSLVVK